MSVQYKDGSLGEVKAFEEAVKEFITNESAKDVIVGDSKEEVETKIKQYTELREKLFREMEKLK